MTLPQRQISCKERLDKDEVGIPLLVSSLSEKAIEATDAAHRQEMRRTHSGCLSATLATRHVPDRAPIGSGYVRCAHLRARCTVLTPHLALMAIAL